MRSRTRAGSSGSPAPGWSRAARSTWAGGDRRRQGAAEGPGQRDRVRVAVRHLPRDPVRVERQRRLGQPGQGDKAVSVDGALAALAKASYGPGLLGIVALGMIAFAAYSIADGRYRRV
jgi:hypothetical protein